MPYRYILYVGDEYERKNIDTVLSAFAGLGQEFSDLVFVKIGHASRLADAERTDRAVARLGLSDRVVIKRTFVPDEELILYYSNAELLVSPSSLEGFGLPIVEACMCKCLPLLSAIDTYREFGLPECLYVDEYMDRRVWQAKMRALLCMSEDRRKTLEDEVQAVGARFTWERNASQTADFYVDILK